MIRPTKIVLVAQLVLICLFNNISRAGTPPLKPVLTLPSRNETKVPLMQYLEWLPSIDPEGDSLAYDIYLGTDSSPSLFRANLYNNWMNEEQNEFVTIIQVNTPNGIEKRYNFIPLLEIFLPETVYYWRVVAKDTEGNETSSEIFTFTTARQNRYPSAPELLLPTDKSVNVTKSSVTLKWKPSVDSDGDQTIYKLFFSEDPVFSSGSLIVDNLTTSFYTFIYDLKDQQTYYWKVVAVDGYDQSNVLGKEIWSFTIENYINDTPEPPLLTFPINGAINIGNSVKLTWNPSYDKDGDHVTYDVYADKNPNPTTLIASGISQNYYITSFEGTDTYYWKIVAHDPKGATSQSKSISSFKPWLTAYGGEIEMVNVEGGTFTMGQNSSIATWESPPHNVTVSDFQISKYEVTYAQFVKFLNCIKNDVKLMESVKSHRVLAFPYVDVYFARKGVGSELYCQLVQVFDATNVTRPVGYETYFDCPIIWDGTSFSVDPAFVNHPVNFCYYDGARFFAEWAGLSIPTEAEWEYAASGGKYTHNYIYSGSNNYNDVAAETQTFNFYSIPTEPIGTKLPNELNVYDMTGPIGEWCLDYFDRQFYANSPAVNPVATSNSDLFYGHIMRGHEYIKKRDSFHNNNPGGIRLVKRNFSTFTVSGTVVKDNFYVIPGLHIKGFELPVRCDKLGYYFFAAQKGWSGTITPYYPGYLFSPENFAITNLEGDIRVRFACSYVGEQTVTGKILDEQGKPLKNVKITAGFEETTTNDDGIYKIEITKYSSFHITPSYNGLAFTPSAIEINDITSDLLNRNFTAAALEVFNITGTVKDSDGNLLTGVTVSGAPSKVVTDKNGFYSITTTKGWSGKLTPENINYIFSPSSIQITSLTGNLNDVNFTGAIKTYTVAGKVLDVSGSPVGGVTIDYGTGKVKTNETGVYSFTVTSGWSGTIIPLLEGSIFAPDQVTINTIDGNQLNNLFQLKSTNTFLLTGSIVDDGGYPLARITLNGLPQGVLTDDKGNFAVEVPLGWSGTIAPFASQYNFSPAEMRVGPVKSNINNIYFRGSIITNTNDDVLFEIHIYPNPSNGLFIIELRENQLPISLMVYDFVGRSIKTEISQLKNDTTLHLAIPHKGIYNLVVRFANGHIYSKKVVVK
ncbi:SUMF1/EgtB/PvdO family nonheme iron enzyme [Chryseosolibacter indicus]|uniref:SUMF1/EgtB/PvdO family nonheme iron enzyme n=1 Tax=Chryseosolibacter indicus TaxID=2782351 RepID=A0ABS5VNV4_9BACT|nr:SUMF1/EgtB/PvdO family nonheme iron enzyme [Chryseosolibacter indicus]MBT1702821.1 SUMF1/EgtB/PvdO family nonheme iron enzyme [Chryseosolibacter indicus]